MRDHRIAMAFSVLGLRAPGLERIENIYTTPG
jgi:5-enolpyruvylshikimate-3-phosphate synthase